MAQDTYASQVIDVWGVVVAVHHHCHHFVDEQVPCLAPKNAILQPSAHC